MQNFDTHSVFHLLHQQVRMITKEFNNQLSDHGLYHSQWSIIFCLEKFGSMTQTDIWKYLNVEAPTITRTLTRMEKNGWVIRTQGEDRRERLIELTESAHEKFKEVNRAVYEFEQDMVKGMSSEELKQFYHLLKKIGPKGEE
ncbi:MarR family winged helix-turn-helix transcriptional regulator [Thalassobacillus pellis]|uniref:MarR family winged helix-turn-helix transcriptional regulator n=1 Tax=Thalassobacillus pellis TaxID=748008 RepID=UPI001EF889F5|nr:MarR family transcriptional regulator [Thalassobacillus pellis]MBM7553071.1 DNA-binding MarR family transcriptional regulator [Thalassobacillus pellis]